MLKLYKKRRIKKLDKPKRHKFLTWGIIIFFAMVMIYGLVEEGMSYWQAQDLARIIAGLGVILIIGGIILDRKILKPDYDKYIEDTKRKEKVEKERRESLEKNYIAKYSIPCGAREITSRVLDNYCDKSFEGIKLKVWKIDDKLRFVAKSFYTDIGSFEIPINNINMYSRIGDLQTYTEISGGGGGGTSIGGAIIGGALAGEAGAVISSRKKVNEIESKQVVIDKRETILEVINENRSYHLTFDSNSYEVFLKLIPGKESAFVANNNQNNNNNEILNNIKQLSDLKDSGILTEEEFTIKKQQLLEKLI